MLTQLFRCFSWFFGNTKLQACAATLPGQGTPRSICLPQANDRLWDIPAVSPTNTLRPESRPLKSIQWLERSKGSARPEKRMVISGRLADVCAELERLAALEGT